MHTAAYWEVIMVSSNSLHKVDSIKVEEERKEWKMERMDEIVDMSPLSF
jgi:hypothetical protein